MSRRIKWVVALVVIVLLGAIGYLTLQQGRYRYEVCVTFNGRSHCATAAGRTPEEATQSAHSVACARLASGREASMICMQTPPASVRSLSPN